MGELRGKVLTVSGPVDPSQLGVVLPHEQPMCDLTRLLLEPEPGFGNGKPLADLSITMENLGAIRKYPYSVRENLKTDSVEEAIEELKLFKSAGGGTLCDVSPIGVRLNRDHFTRIAKATGLTMVASTGLYHDRLMSQQHKDMSIEEITSLLVGEIMEGMPGCGVRCGVIGEVGCSSPLHDTERKSLRASVKAQRITGAPIMIHTGHNRTSPFDIVEVLEEAGADLSHVAFGHLERTLYEDEDLLSLAGKGCYIEFDLFGMEGYHQLSPMDFPSDGGRIKKLKTLIDNGFSDKLLISCDIHTKHRQVRYGGHGYCHILQHVVPLMMSRGVGEETVWKIVKTNPQRWLTFH